MELETINKLFLELSQVATAKTAKQIALEDSVARRGKLLAEIYNNDGSVLPGDLARRTAEEIVRAA